MAIWWNGDDHSDDENLRWAWLRAAEWLSWPVFIAQPIVPLLLVLNPTPNAVWQIMPILVAANLAWRLVAYRWISLRLATAGCLFVHLKWPSSFFAGVSLLSLNHYWLAGIAGLWPLVTLGFCGGGMVGLIQKKFLLRLGYVPLAGDWKDCLIANFYRPATSTVSES